MDLEALGNRGQRVGDRLGLGPKAWLVLGGRTLLERAVSVMREVCERVIVGVRSADVERASALCGADATVVAGGATHRETMPLVDTREFGTRTFEWRAPAAGWQWARVAVWDVAGNGAFVNPHWKQ